MSAIDRLRKRVASRWFQELNDLSEVDMLAGELREIVAAHDALLAENERLRGRHREMVERRDYAITHAKVCEEKCNAATAELGRVTRRADFLDSSLDAMRQQAIEAVKERNAATARAEQAETALAILLSREGGATEITQAEMVSLDRRGSFVSSRTVMGSERLAYVTSKPQPTPPQEPEPGRMQYRVFQIARGTTGVTGPWTDVPANGHCEFFGDPRLASEVRIEFRTELPSTAAQDPAVGVDSGGAVSGDPT